MQAAWQQVGRVGFQHESVLGDCCYQGFQVASPTLIADPACNTDIEIHVQIASQFGFVTCEAMCNSALEAVAHGLQNFDEFLVCIPLVKEYRELALCCKFELSLKGISLRLSWRKIAKVVESAFADCNNNRERRKFTQCLANRDSVVAGMMRVNSGRGIEAAWVCFSQVSGIDTALLTAAGDDHPSHAVLTGSLDDRITIRVKGIMCQIGTDVEQVRVRQSCGISARAPAKNCCTDREEYGTHDYEN